MQKNEQLTSLHDSAVMAAEGATDALRVRLTDHPDQPEQLRQIRAEILDYATAFEGLVDDVAVVGFDEGKGIMGQLRTSVHSVEETLNSVDAPNARIATLMMRRHEKDFIARLRGLPADVRTADACNPDPAAGRNDAKHNLRWS